MFLAICIKKGGWIFYPIVMCTFAYTSISAEAFAILGFFLVVDTITGFIKTIAVGGKPTSRRLIIGIISKLLVLMIPLLIALLAKVSVGTSATVLVKSAIGLLALAEFYSITQNIISIKLQREIAEYDAVTGVLTKILEFVKGQLEKGIPKT